ncbi:RxLR effector protein [Phytophthora megakarya]|uniref:RxLR effector protein n=1 Tax=Phytophthora megakarya TaxID=4795 RepID=A0A225VKM8_9STRA|nr:RxLR effector protein [Phytophthora megakarya]
MVSPRITTLPIYVMVLFMNIFFVCSVTAKVGQPMGIVENPSQIRPLREVETSLYFLRAGGTGGGVANGISHKDERGPEIDKVVAIPLLKLSLNIFLSKQVTPTTVLNGFQQHLPMRKDILVLWLDYVQRYRMKTGTLWPDNSSVLNTLKQFIPDDQLPEVFKAMKKNTKLESFGKDLETVASHYM